MNQFFIESSSVREDKIVIEGPEVNHIVNVLKIKKGEKISLAASDTGLTYTCTVADYDASSVTCLIEDVQSESRELPINITLYQGLPKSDKLEFVIQKAVEMGAARIVPVAMKRSVVKLSPEKADKKVTRWNAIAASAASQSKRSMIPEVSAPMSYDEAINEASACDAILVPYELAEGMDETRQILSGLKNSGTRSVAVFIGPEGGFDDGEIGRAREAGAHIITLGNRILRTETAPIAILSWLTYIWDK